MNKRIAFTLAEVLITLGIIGVVAAMTIPTLVKNYEKKVTATKLKKVYSTLNQIAIRSVADNGPIPYLNRTKITAELSKEYIETYWFPYMKSPVLYYKLPYGRYKISSCTFTLLNGGNCNLDVYFGNIGLSQGKFLFSSADDVIYYLTILSWIADENGNSIPVFAQNDVRLIVDINGVRGPNVMGKDVFRFQFSPEKNVIYPYCYDCSVNTLKSNCSKQGSGEVCAAKIMRDGWQIKDDYPW